MHGKRFERKVFVSFQSDLDSDCDYSELYLVSQFAQLSVLEGRLSQYAQLSVLEGRFVLLFVICYYSQFSMLCYVFCNFSDDVSY